MSIPSLQRGTCATRNAYPREVFDRMTDILADLMLEDLKRYPQLPSHPRIDRFGGRENTAVPAHEGAS